MISVATRSSRGTELPRDRVAYREDLIDELVGIAARVVEGVDGEIFDILVAGDTGSIDRVYCIAYG